MDVQILWSIVAHSGPPPQDPPRITRRAASIQGPAPRGMRRSVAHHAWRAKANIMGGNVISISLKVGSSAKRVEVSSHAFPTRSKTPDALAPSGLAYTDEVPPLDSIWVE